MTKTTTKALAPTGTGKAVKPVKEKRRNNEKRKEKSRDAARCRRSRETEIFQDLASLLPMRPEEVEHLDKASVMRLSIAFLKARNMLDLFPEISEITKKIEIKEDNDASTESMDEFNFDETKLSLKSLGLEPETVVLQALDGFLMVLSADGDITYISENVSEYLGISQIDIMGQPIWDYSHQCDHDELREALNGRRHSPSELQNGVANSDCQPMENRDFFLRLKCTLTSRGRSVNIKSASYKVLHITGHIACKDKEGQRQLVSIARPLPHPANIEVPLGSSTFLTQHTLSMKFSYVDDMLLSLLGYEPADLLGKSLYDCHHGSDAEHLMATFKHVISKGQSETSRYRFLAKTGGYAWVVTQATVVYDKQKPHSVVCVNYVLSGVENKDDILSCAQLEARQQLLSEEPEQCGTENGDSVVCDGGDQQSVEQQCPAVTAPSLPAIACARVQEVLTPETVPIPAEVRFSDSAEQTQRYEPLPVAVSGGKVLLCAKNDTSAAEKQLKGVLREPNGNISATPKTAFSASGCRPVSVTASIFNSLPTGGGNLGSEKPRTPNNARVCGVPQPQQPLASAALQSVTAKLFVTLPPASGGASVAGCNGAINGGGSGAGNKPQHATEKIFAPRTEDMNKGFLMFSDEEPGLTMLKDEPDDLTHLAPTAGDACIPLEESGTFFNEMFEDFIIPDSYTLLQDELCSLDSQDTRLDASPITVQSGTVCIPVSGTDAISGSLSAASVVSAALACTVSGSSDGTPSLASVSIGSQTHQHSHASSPGASSASRASISVSSSPVPSSPSRSHVSSNPNSPSGTSGLGSSASSTVSNGDQQQATIGTSGNQHNASSNDPFINYRDEANEVSPSPHLLSPGISKSPESSSLPSLCSPNGSLPEDELAFMNLNMDELDLSMRAPYISMSEVDDLPLLTSDDLLWGVPAATIEGNAPGTSISAFGLTGKFYIKDEFPALGTSPTPTGSGSGALVDQPTTTVQRSLQVGKEHGLIIDVASGTASGSIEQPAANNGNNDSKSTLTTTTPPSIDSSLAALLCGGNVISIQPETSNLSQQHGNTVLIAHTNASVSADHQQQQRHSNQQHHSHQQLQQNGAQQQEMGPSIKRIKLSEANLLQHSMVVLPTNPKLCDTWKFDDLLQLNGATVSNNGKTNMPLASASQTNIIASFVTTAGKKPTVAGGINGNNKRTLNGGSESSTETGSGNTCKRLRASSGASASTSPSSAPQLLQQLMAPSPIPQKLKSKSRSAQDATGSGRWPNGQTGGNGELLQEQSGNSVLMNLLVSGCDNTVPLTPPEILIEGALPDQPTGSANAMERSNNAADDMLFSLTDDDDTGVLFSSANPLIGGQALLNDTIARPLTIETRACPVVASQKPGANSIGTHPSEFSTIVSPSLLTPTDLEIWRAIQQGQLDPKQLSLSGYYGHGATGGHIPKSLDCTPTAQLTGLLDDPAETNLLATLDGLGDLDVGGLQQQQQFMATGAFRAISAYDEDGRRQHGLI
ncbi:protein similar [Anopheles nili]|uniref:protein similar n=1 Tax=Anopheles nili TaxID=185578 RepID=UPI00237BC0DF|nr:protein similar [Anopheles nili]